jgi:hypothetical protein
MLTIQKILKDRRLNGAKPAWNQQVTSGSLIAIFDCKALPTAAN